MRWFSLAILLAASSLFSGCSGSQEPLQPRWAEAVGQEVRSLGISNWIVVAESSFPVGSRRGVRTVVVDAEIPELVDFVVNELERSENVKASFNVARELPFVENDDAPGVDEFRGLLNEALHGHEVRQMDHRALSLLALSDASKYVVLVLKTTTAIPYSNVYIELDSGYWNREAEDKMRSKLNAVRAKVKNDETISRGN